jgi:hypothetical protein
MSLDHGLLNLPLSKRGNIDREIDAHKAAERREREAIARETRKAFDAARAEALGLIERMTDEHIARLAAKFGWQARSVRKRLRSEAGLNPTLVVRALRDGGAE